MTKSSEIPVTESHSISENESGEKIPYALPTDAQLLAYWHYQNNAERSPDLWKAHHKASESSEEKILLKERRKDPNSSLIRQLRGNGARETFSRSRYISDLRLLTKWRLLVGQKRDGCILLDQQLDIEQKKFQQIKAQYKECVNALEQFLARDHELSMKSLKDSQNELAVTMELSERRDELSRRYGHARLEVYHWEEAWRTVKACHRFLHRVSPIGPSSDDEDDDNNEEIQSDSTESLKVNKMSISKSQIKTNTTSDYGNSGSLESLIAAFEKEANGLSKSLAKKPSDLDLTEANDLLKIFRSIEIQNLNALIHLESLGGPMADMIARIDIAEGRVKREIDDVLEGIKQLELSIVHEEKRARRLERQCEQLVEKNFRSLICSEDALKARVLIEDAYESCVATNEAGLESLAMARALENVYERLSAELDVLPRHLVVICEREGFKQELKESREIEDAARKFDLMHRLLAALRRLMEPTEKPRRRLVKRSTPRMRKKRDNSKHVESAKASPDRGDTIKLQFDLFGKACKLKKEQDAISDFSEEDD